MIAETTVTSVCDGEGMHPMAPHREMLRNIRDVLLSFVTW